MDYSEWINNIEILKNSNNKQILEQLKNEKINPSFNDMLILKLEKLIYDKFNLNINKLINNLSFLFYDKDSLNIELLTLKNNLKFILEIINLKQIPAEKRKQILDDIKKKSDEVYDILIKEANKEDPVGVQAMIIKDSKMKWSDNNEL